MAVYAWIVIEVKNAALEVRTYEGGNDLPWAEMSHLPDTVEVLIASMCLIWFPGHACRAS